MSSLIDRDDLLIMGSNRLLRHLLVYGAAHGVWIAVCLLATRFFFPGARLVRLPIFIRGRSRISFGRGFTCGYFNRIDVLDAAGSIQIGERVQINDFCHIAAVHSIRIGDDALIASRVFIADHDHGTYSGVNQHSSPSVVPAARKIRSAEVVIEDRVWIGEGVAVLSGVRIGAGSVIGAGAVVARDVPSNCIAVGVPAKVVARYDARSDAWIKCNDAL